MTNDPWLGLKLNNPGFMDEVVDCVQLEEMAKQELLDGQHAFEKEPRMSP